MRKLAPLIVIIAGLTTIIFSAISLLAVHNVISSNGWVGKFQEGNTGSTLSYVVAIIIGCIQIALGRWSWRNAKGIASLLLIIFFALSIGILIYASTTGSTWPISTIISLVINGLALIGLIIGFVKVK